MRRSIRFTFVVRSQAIHVVDALNLKVLKNITTDQSGNPLTNAGSVGATGNDTTRGWNDAAYLEVGESVTCAGLSQEPPT